MNENKNKWEKELGGWRLKKRKWNYEGKKMRN